MTDHGVSDSDMPTFTWPTWPETGTLDALLSGNCRPEQAPAELRPVAEVLVALQAPPDQREVAGWGEALTLYRQVAGRPGMSSLPGTSGRPRPRRLRSRRPRRVAPPLSTKLAAAAGAAAIAVLGGGAAAAYTGSLPAGLQKFVHAAIAAPDAPGSVSPATSARKGTGNPVEPSVSDGAAYGLCNAYQHAEEHGNASQRSVAFRNLVNAAGGAGKVAAYCASVPHPGNTNPPGRRVGQTASPANTKHGRKPTTPPGKPTTAPGNGNGNGGGNGNEHGRN